MDSINTAVTAYQTRQKVQAVTNSVTGGGGGGGGGQQHEINDEQDGHPIRKRFHTWKEWTAFGGGVACCALNVLRIPLLISRNADSLPFPRTSRGTKINGYISSGLGILVSPIAVYNESQLAKEGSFREALTYLREQINRLENENEKLTAEVDKLQRSVQTMQEIEEALTDLTSKQGTDLESFMGLIQENKKISIQMRELLRARVLEDIIALVLRCDRDGDFQLKGEELDELMLGLGLIEGIEYDEEPLRNKFITNGGSIRVVLNTVKDLLRDDDENDNGDGNNNKSLMRVRSSHSIMEISRSSFLESIRMKAFENSTA